MSLGQFFITPRKTIRTLKNAWINSGWALILGVFAFSYTSSAEAAFTTYQLSAGMANGFCTNTTPANPSPPLYLFRALNATCGVDNAGFAGNGDGTNGAFTAYGNSQTFSVSVFSPYTFDISGFDVRNQSGSSKTITVTSKDPNGTVIATETFSAPDAATTTITLAAPHTGVRITEINFSNANISTVTFGNFVLQYNPATVPGAPTIGSATAGAASASVSFTAPASNGGAAITSYTVTASPGGQTGTGVSSPITVTGLNPGVAYTFTVKATNSVGTGAASAASNSVVPVVPIPTLSEWALILFGTLMAGAMVWYQRRRA